MSFLLRVLLFVLCTHLITKTSSQLIQLPKVTSGSDCTSGNSPPLLPQAIEVFASVLANVAGTSTTMKNIYDLANLPGNVTGPMFYRTVQRSLSNIQSPVADSVAALSRDSAAATMDNLTPAKYARVIGNAVGKILFQKGKLDIRTTQTVAIHFVTHTEEMAQKLKSEDPEGYSQAIVDSIVSFVGCMGISPISAIPEVAGMFWTELECFANGVCA